MKLVTNVKFKGWLKRKTVKEQRDLFLNIFKSLDGKGYDEPFINTIVTKIITQSYVPLKRLSKEDFSRVTRSKKTLVTKHPHELERENKKHITDFSNQCKNVEEAQTKSYALHEEEANNYIATNTSSEDDAKNIQQEKKHNNIISQADIFYQEGTENSVTAMNSIKSENNSQEKNNQSKVFSETISFQTEDATNSIVVATTNSEYSAKCSPDEKEQSKIKSQTAILSQEEGTKNIVAKATNFEDSAKCTPDEKEQSEMKSQTAILSQEEGTKNIVAKATNSEDSANNTKSQNKEIKTISKTKNDMTNMSPVEGCKQLALDVPSECTEKNAKEYAENKKNEICNRNKHRKPTNKINIENIKNKINNKLRITTLKTYPAKKVTHWKDTSEKIFHNSVDNLKSACGLELVKAVSSSVIKPTPSESVVITHSTSEGISVNTIESNSRLQPKTVEISSVQLEPTLSTLEVSTSSAKRNNYDKEVEVVNKSSESNSNNSSSICNEDESSKVLNEIALEPMDGQAITSKNTSVVKEKCERKSKVDSFSICNEDESSKVLNEIALESMDGQAITSKNTSVVKEKCESKSKVESKVNNDIFTSKNNIEERILHITEVQRKLEQNLLKRKMQENSINVKRPRNLESNEESGKNSVSVEMPTNSLSTIRSTDKTYFLQQKQMENNKDSSCSTKNTNFISTTQCNDRTLSKSLVNSDSQNIINHNFLNSGLLRSSYSSEKFVKNSLEKPQSPNVIIKSIAKSHEPNLSERSNELCVVDNNYMATPQFIETHGDSSKPKSSNGSNDQNEFLNTSSSMDIQEGEKKTGNLQKVSVYHGLAMKLSEDKTLRLSSEQLTCQESTISQKSTVKTPISDSTNHQFCAIVTKTSDGTKEGCADSYQPGTFPGSSAPNISPNPKTNALSSLNETDEIVRSNSFKCIDSVITENFINKENPTHSIMSDNMRQNEKETLAVSDNTVSSSCSLEGRFSRSDLTVNNENQVSTVQSHPSETVTSQEELTQFSSKANGSKLVEATSGQVLVASKENDFQEILVEMRKKKNETVSVSENNSKTRQNLSCSKTIDFKNLVLNVIHLYKTAFNQYEKNKDVVPSVVKHAAVKYFLTVNRNITVNDTDVPFIMLKTYAIKFKETTETNITKLAEVLHLSIADCNRWKERINSAHKLTSSLREEEKTRANFEYNKSINSRSKIFSNIFLSIFDEFKEVAPLLLMPLYFRITQALLRFDKENSAYAYLVRKQMVCLLKNEDGVLPFPGPLKDDILNFLTLPDEVFLSYFNFVKKLLVSFFMIASDRPEATEVLDFAKFEPCSPQMQQLLARRQQIMNWYQENRGMWTNNSPNVSIIFPQSSPTTLPSSSTNTLCQDQDQISYSPQSDVPRDTNTTFSHQVPPNNYMQNLSTTTQNSQQVLGKVPDVRQKFQKQPHYETFIQNQNPKPLYQSNQVMHQRMFQNTNGFEGQHVQRPLQATNQMAFQDNHYQQNPNFQVVQNPTPSYCFIPQQQTTQTISQHVKYSPSNIDKHSFGNKHFELWRRQELHSNTTNAIALQKNTQIGHSVPKTKQPQPFKSSKPQQRISVREVVQKHNLLMNIEQRPANNYSVRPKQLVVPQTIVTPNQAVGSSTQRTPLIVSTKVVPKVYNPEHNQTTFPESEEVRSCMYDTCQQLATLACGICKASFYCSQNCQVQHWYAGHSVQCLELQK